MLVGNQAADREQVGRRVDQRERGESERERADEFGDHVAVEDGRACERVDQDAHLGEPGGRDAGQSRNPSPR